MVMLYSVGVCPPFGGVVNVTGANIPFPTPVFPTGSAGGGLALRLCAQIYNDMDDVDRLAAAVLKRS